MANKYFKLPTTTEEEIQNRTLYEDDFYRGRLKELSSFCFPKVFTEGPAYMLLTHLHALTGKAPYTEEQIIDDITTWVSKDRPDGKPKTLDEGTVKTVLDGVFDTWYRGESEGGLNFNDFCNDYLRWGTSGGAKKTTILDENYRTKWALAYSLSTNKDGTINKERNIYQAVTATDDNVSKVALKEEAQKTREIITTSMPSYLRQAYLVYRWGKPQLPSPISAGSWIAHFEEANPSWYGSIDGEQFDKTIPAWFVRDIIDRLGGLDAETRMVADIELKSLDNLNIEWNDRRWKWDAGVLSGWRLTSLIGTLATHCAAHYIKEKYRMEGSILHGELGDDLVMFSNSASLTPEQLVDAYNQFGLKANLHKTTSGGTGEFLRKVLSEGGAWGYPALALRSIVYANPWISSYSFEQESELSSTWITFISRLLPHATKPLGFDIFDDCILDLRNNFGKGPWIDWLKTPISAGGGGTTETSDITRWTYLEHKEKKSKYTTDDLFFVPTMLGIFKSKLIFKKVADFCPIHYRTVIHNSRDITTSEPYTAVNFKHNTNITDTVFSFLSHDMTRPEFRATLTGALPRSIRTSTRRNVIEYMLMGVSSHSGFTSMCHTKELSSIKTSLNHYITRAVSISKRFLTPKVIKPAITFYFLSTFKEYRMPYGTW